MGPGPATVSGSAALRPGPVAPEPPRLEPVVGDPLPQAEYDRIYALVPRLTVEVVVVSVDGVLLTRRRTGPCQDLWHVPGGTVRYGEPLTDAVHRVAGDELGVEVAIDRLLDYVEYPSHRAQGIDWPVGMAFAVHLTPSSAGRFRPEPDRTGWFFRLPDDMHDEQKALLRTHGLAG